MSRNTKIVLAKDGTKEHTVKAGSIAVPDLWRLSGVIRYGQKIDDGPACADLIAEAWQLCHGLLRHIIEQPD